VLILTVFCIITGRLSFSYLLTITDFNFVLAVFCVLVGFFSLPPKKKYSLDNL